MRNRGLTLKTQMLKGRKKGHMKKTENKICKFSNRFNNSWMKSSIQSILNMRVTRRCMTQEKLFIEASFIPCKSYTHSSSPSRKILLPNGDLSSSEGTERERPVTVFLEKTEISDLLEAILVWLDSFCGNTDTEMYSENTCRFLHSKTTKVVLEKSQKHQKKVSKLVTIFRLEK